MKNNIKNKLLMSITALLVIAALSGCTLAAGSSTDNGQDDNAVNQKITADASESTALNSVNVSSSTDGKPDVTDKDKDTSYDESEAQKIDMSAGTGTVNITGEGTYIVTGSTSDGMIVIEVSEEEDVHLVLRDASITSKTSAAVYIISADEVYITLEGNNTLANGGTFKAIDENDIDSVIYSKDDLTVNGTEANTIPNQMMGGGGRGGNNGEMPGNGEDFGRGGQMPDQRGNRGGQGGRSGF